MRKLKFRFIIIFIIFLVSQNAHVELNSNWECPEQGGESKKILIIYNKSGGGHETASNSLKQLLSKDYCLAFLNSSVNLIPEIPGFGSSDDIFNWARGKQFTDLIEFGTKYGVPLFRKLNLNKIRNKLSNAIDKYMPDLVISTIPIFNTIFAEATPPSTPFVLITLDTDLSNWELKTKGLRNNIIVTTGFQNI